MQILLGKGESPGWERYVREDLEAQLQGELGKEQLNQLLRTALRRGKDSFHGTTADLMVLNYVAESALCS